MRSFHVITSDDLNERCIIGKIVHLKREYTTREYTIKVIGNRRPFHLVPAGMETRSTRTLRYDNDPHLSIGDVIESHNGVCYVHFSQTSNDACLVVNNDCNEACLNCPQVDRTKNPGLREKNIQLVTLLPSYVKSLALSGGEPTFDVPALLELITTIYKKYPTITLDILTNGIALSHNEDVEALASVLKQEQTTFCITLYGDTPAIHDRHTQVPGSFARVNLALHHLASFGYRIELRYLITKINFERIPSFIEYAYDNFPFIDHISLMGMEFSGYASQHADLLFVEQRDYIPYLKRAVGKAVIRDIPVFIYNHQVCLLPKELWRFTVSSISDWKRGYHERCKRCDIMGYCGGYFTTSSPVCVPSEVFPISLNYKGMEAL